MNKSVVLGIVAFGGLVLVTMLLPRGEVTNEEALVTQTEAEVIPADLPVFPIYEPATLTRVQESTGETSRDVMISLSTMNDRETIHNWYREQLSTGGWSIKSDRNVAGYQIIQGEKENLFTSLQVASGETADEQVISQQLKVRAQ